MRHSQGILTVLCILLGVLPTTFIELFNIVPQQILGHGLAQTTKHGWLWLTPVSQETASYSAPLVAITLVGALVIGLWLLGRGALKPRRCDPWDCGFAPPNSRMQYTASAFAQPIQRVFAMVFRIDENVLPQSDGRPRHHLYVIDRTWDMLYRPIVRVVETASRKVTLLQSGNVRIYLGWSFATLLLLLWIVS